MIALSGADGTISLEPAGQFELSGAPLENLHQTCAEAARHLGQCKMIGERLGPRLPRARHVAGQGAATSCRSCPRAATRSCSATCRKVGSLGLDMMLRTCTIQVNLDYSSEADMVKKFRVGLALQPVATALFANSPLTEGKPNGYKSFRSHIWEDTDPDRTGMLPFVFEDGFGYERYCDYALDVPMYFVFRDGKYIDVAGESFRDFLDGKLPQLPGEKPTADRLDRPSLDRLPRSAPEELPRDARRRRRPLGPDLRRCPALWVGLLYDDQALDAAWDLVKHWTIERAREAAPRRARSWRSRRRLPDGGTMRDFAGEVLDIAAGGLTRRGVAQRRRRQ